MNTPVAATCLAALAIATSVEIQAASDSQKLYAFATDGKIYRVDNYATNPTPVLVGSSGSLNDGVAIAPGTGLATSCEAVSVAYSPIYNWSSSYSPNLIGSALVPTANGLDYSASGTLWAVGAFSAGLFTVDPTTAQSTFAASIPGMQSDGDVAVGPDGRVHVAAAFSRLATFDPASGQASLQPTTGTAGVITGFEIDCDGTGYMTRISGEFFVFDLDTRVATQIGDLGFTCNDLAFRIPAEAPQSPGSTYCSPAIINSSGAPARILALGSDQVADNSLTLVADKLPTNSPGIFLNSLAQAMVPMAGGSQGTLCLGGAIGRYAGPGQIRNSGATGSFQLALDLSQHPTPAGIVAVLPGDTWHFQAWFRDMNPGSTSNFTDAWTVMFQ